jgi:hypothetical protein
MANEYEVELHEGTKTLIKYNGNEQNIILPDDIEVIGENAFAECVNLISVKLPDRLKTIEAYAFANCISLTSLNLPDSMNGIGWGAFWSCNKLPFLIIPKGIKSIDEAFQWCEELEIGIYYHHVSSEPSSIQGFWNKYIHLLDDEEKRIGKLFILDENTDNPGFEFVSRLLSGVVMNLSEYDELFSSIADIVIKKASAAICRLEYPLELLDKYKKGYITYLKKHAALLLPYLIKIGDVNAINIFGKVDAIPQENLCDYIDAANRQSKTEILAVLLDYQDKTHIRGDAPSLDLDAKKPLSNWVTYENEDGTLTITKYLGNDQDVIIPTTINGKQVKSIEGNLGSLKVSIFFSRENLIQSVTIEEGVQVIGERAFLDCGNLKSAEIPASITSIGKEAYYGCKILSSVVLPGGVKNIGEAAFDECPDLVIHSPKGSYATEYAKKNRINYVET